MSDNKLYDYIDSVLDGGLGRDYWFVTKQTMSDFYMPFFIAQIVETYEGKKHINETFASYYTRSFRENSYAYKKFPKQSESENTYRNAIISEFLGLFYREKIGYETGKVTPAYHTLKKYIKDYSDIQKFKLLVDRQIEKLCLNVNKNARIYDDVKGVTIFPVVFLYKVLLELYHKYGDSKLYYKEFILFLVFSKQYDNWKNVIELIECYRSVEINDEYLEKINRILSDNTMTNIRFDTLLGSLEHIKYYFSKDDAYYKINDGVDSIKYIRYVVDMYEHSDYFSCNDKNILSKFQQSDKYFIGDLDCYYLYGNQNGDLEPKQDENIEDFNKNRLEVGENVILYGVPGAGKSWTIDNEYSNEDTIKERVVFHPDYTYSDFVGQILPQSKDGDVTYDFVPGPFTKIMKEAYYNPTIKYILVIEEINRGNAPAIFGDIFQLLDRHQSSNANLQQKKGESVYGIINADVAKIMYNDSNHEVKIPSNLSIICTMNTSDQNVFTLDTAFQRRWNMRLIENDFKDDTEEDKKFAETNILDTGVTWKHFCNKINDLILDKNQNMTSSEDKRLGVHFVHIEDLTFDNNEDSSDNSEKIKAKLQNRRFPEKVIKYLWDDAFKFYRDEIFKGEFNSLEKVIREFTSRKKEERFNIFKDNIKAEIISKPEQR